MLPELLRGSLSHFAVNCADKPRFFGLKPWYEYLQLSDVGGACEVNNFKVLGGDSSFLPILLVLVDNLLIIAAYVAVGFLIYGGIIYTTSQGSSDRTAKAQGTIINALVGLVIALIAAQFVAYIGGRLVP